MIELASLLLAVAIGCALVWRFGACLAAVGPRWVATLILFGSGAPLGLGLTSCLFFLCRLAAPGLPRLSLIVEVAILGWLIYAIARVGIAQPSTADERPALFVQWLTGAMILALAIATGAMWAAWDANPQGNWDAWSIWNLRAKFLAVGEAPERAWSALLAGTHAEYPLLVSGVVARAWAYAGSTGPVAPIAASYLFFLALLAILTGGIAAYSGRTAGLLAGLALLGAPAVLREVPSQYADIPLACYMAASIALALLGRPLLAGLCAGLAAWTKEEGILFLLVFFALTALLRREQALRAAAGALPGVLLTAIFKLALAPAVPMSRAQNIFGVARIAQTLSGFAQEFSAGWLVPTVPLVALALGLGLRSDRPKDLMLAVAAPLLMLGGYFGIFLVRSQDLSWQLGTALSRLFVQVWPLILIAVFTGLRQLDSFIMDAPSKSHKKAGR